eukprot:scaffold12235_cov44-Attheya_sp.AAC.1
MGVWGFSSRVRSVLSPKVPRSSATLDMVAAPISQHAAVDEVTDAPLFRDMELLNDMLPEVVQREDPQMHDIYQRFRQHGLHRANGRSDPQPLERMIQCVKDLTPELALGVVRTFTLALNLNGAEVQHRVPVLRENDLLDDDDSDAIPGPLPMVEDSVRGALDAILSKTDFSISKTATNSSSI